MTVKEKFVGISWDSITLRIFPIVSLYMIYTIYEINIKQSNLKYISLGLIVLAIIFIRVNTKKCYYFRIEELVNKDTLFICISFMFIGLTVYQQNFNLINIALCLFAIYIVPKYLKYGFKTCEDDMTAEIESGKYKIVNNELVLVEK